MARKSGRAWPQHDGAPSVLGDGRRRAAEPASFFDVQSKGYYTEYELGFAVTDMIICRLRENMQQIIVTAPGCVLEDKGHALALHFRLAHQHDAMRVTEQFLTAVRAYQKRGFAVQIIKGQKVIEVQPFGTNKGKVLSVLLQGRQACPIYLGDDKTDEEVFGALSSRGITVLVADPPRPTAARFYLHSPAEVEEFFLLLLQRRQQVSA